jgi:hypothetical protein
MVRAVGIEPTLCCQNWILSPARLPVPPRPLVANDRRLALRTQTSVAAAYAIGTTGRNRLGTKLDPSANGAPFGTVQPA